MPNKDRVKRYTGLEDKAPCLLYLPVSWRRVAIFMISLLQSGRESWVGHRFRV
jgi:hypothetical protein